jgi:hypothetical protein
VSSDGTGKKGATNHMGELFTGEGAETHPGLLVCDGAAVPASLGVNPFATITAFAERSVELAAEKFGLLIDYETRNGRHRSSLVPSSLAHAMQVILTSSVNQHTLCPRTPI